jgi:hypothetical protein
MISMIRRALKPWFFVVLGVGLTIASAIMTNAVIADMNRQMLTLEHECVDIEKQIDQQWQQTKSLEYEEYTGTVILLFSNAGVEKGKADAKASAVDIALNRYVEKILLSGRVPPEETTEIRDLIGKGKVSDALTRIFSLVDKYRVETIEAINALYTEKYQKEQERTRLRGQVAKFSAIALFMHVMGVIMVLIKDVAKTTRTLTPKTYHGEPLV